MSQTPRTDNFKSQGREWLPLGIFEKVERENTLLRDALETALDGFQQLTINKNENYISRINPENTAKLVDDASNDMR